MRLSTSLFVLALVARSSVDAHITLWHKSLFGFNYPRQSNDTVQSYNTNTMVVPLRGNDNLTTAQWFAHGAKGYPPAEGEFLELPTGGSATFELACNRALTSYRNPNLDTPLPVYACGNDTGPLHNANNFNSPLNISLFGGTALAIAYTSDVENLQPGNMTIISVNRTSPWTREVTYHIPADMPPCPDGGCLVTWNWIHLTTHNEGYGAEIYNTLYRAKITGNTNARNAVGPGNVPRKCDNGTACVTGPKQPMYLWQKDGNNMDPPKAHSGEENPHYSPEWGFQDGPQDDAVLLNVNSNAGRSVAPGIAGVVLGAAMTVLL